MTPLTGLYVAFGANEQTSAAAPVSPEAATTVTCRLATWLRTASTWLACALVTHGSPPTWPPSLVEITPPSVLASRSEAMEDATAFAVLFNAVGRSSTMTIAAPGATACTISASSTS